MNYSSALAYIDSFTNYEIRREYKYNEIYFNLDRIRSILELFNNPHKKLNCIHIAGTKGKGSVAIMLSTILAEAGYKVGLFTSPHIVDFRERIRIMSKYKMQSGKCKIKEELIPKQEVIQFAKKIRHSSPITHHSLPPTTFELYTTLAFNYFVKSKVDLAVIEVGLGGRLDATNVIEKPIVCVITRIGYDHMQELGNTLQKIAYEKAGIIKNNSNVIVLKQNSKVMKVVKEVANKKNATVEEVIPTSIYPVFDVPHQQENIALVAAVCNLLKIKEEIIKKALSEVKLPARCEIISENPTVMLDAAHNIDSIKAQLKFITSKVNYEKVIFIISIFKDKDIKGFLKEVTKLANYVIFTQIDNPRCEEPKKLARIIKRINNKIIVKVYEDLNEAINNAFKIATEEDLISITGSFYLIGEVLKILNRN